MRKIVALVLSLFIVLNAFSADSAKDKARFKKNEKWKTFIAKTEKKMSEIEKAVFKSIRFEGNTPANDFEYIRNTPSERYKLDYEEVTIPTIDGVDLKGWFFPVNEPKGTLVVLHGYSSDAAFALYQSKFLIEKGYQLLIYNARFWSYSKTPEKYTLSLEKEFSDVGSAIQYLKMRKDVDMEKLGIIGFSQGAYKTIIAGARYKEFKVVIEDASPINRMWAGDSKEVLDLTMKETGEDFSNKEYITTEVIAKISPRAVLILHGGKDTAVNIKDSEANFDRALEPKEFKIFPKSAHCLGMVQSDKEDYIKAVAEFLEKHLK